MHHFREYKYYAVRGSLEDIAYVPQEALKANRYTQQQDCMQMGTA